MSSTSPTSLPATLLKATSPSLPIGATDSRTYISFGGTSSILMLAKVYTDKSGSPYPVPGDLPSLLLSTMVEDAAAWEGKRASLAGEGAAVGCVVSRSDFTYIAKALADRPLHSRVELLSVNGAPTIAASGYYRLSGAKVSEPIGTFESRGVTACTAEEAAGALAVKGGKRYRITVIANSYAGGDALLSNAHFIEVFGEKGDFLGVVAGRGDGNTYVNSILASAGDNFAPPVTVSLPDIPDGLKVSDSLPLLVSLSPTGTDHARVSMSYNNIAVSGTEPAEKCSNYNRKYLGPIINDGLTLWHRNNTNKQARIDMFTSPNGRRFSYLSGVRDSALQGVKWTEEGVPTFSLPLLPDSIPTGVADSAPSKVPGVYLFGRSTIAVLSDSSCVYYASLPGEYRTNKGVRAGRPLDRWAADAVVNVTMGTDGAVNPDAIRPHTVDCPPSCYHDVAMGAAVSESRAARGLISKSDAEFLLAALGPDAEEWSTSLGFHEVDGVSVFASSDDTRIHTVPVSRREGTTDPMVSICRRLPLRIAVDNPRADYFLITAESSSDAMPLFSIDAFDSDGHRVGTVMGYHGLPSPRRIPVPMSPTDGATPFTFTLPKLKKGRGKDATVAMRAPVSAGAPADVEVRIGSAPQTQDGTDVALLCEGDYLWAGYSRLEALVAHGVKECYWQGGEPLPARPLPVLFGRITARCAVIGQRIAPNFPLELSGKLASHERWVADPDSGTRADFTDAELSRITLTGYTLDGALMSHARAGWATLADASFVSADLSFAELSFSCLSRSNFSRANIQGADLSESIADGALFNKAMMSGAILKQARVYRSSFEGADLTGANLTRADLHDANLRDAGLTRADLTRADLREADLTGADLAHADLTGADLTGADLTDAILTDAIWTDAILTGVVGLVAPGSAK